MSVLGMRNEAWDHLSAIEVAHLPQGKYTLTIAIPKAHWFAQKKGEPTCLSLNFIMEFIQQQDDGSPNGPIQIQTVYPPSQSSLKLSDTLNMMLHLSKAIDFREAAR